MAGLAVKSDGSGSEVHTRYTSIEHDGTRIDPPCDSFGYSRVIHHEFCHSPRQTDCTSTYLSAVQFTSITKFKGYYQITYPSLVRLFVIPDGVTSFLHVVDLGFVVLGA